MWANRLVAFAAAAVVGGGANAVDVVPLGISQAESDSYVGWGIGLFPYHLLFEQVRFYGPTGAVGSSIYYWGRPVYNGVSSDDLCSDASVCGDAVSFNTRLVGTMGVTARDAANNPAVVVQNLGTKFTGLGVASKDANGVVVGDMAINMGESVTVTFDRTVRLMGLTLWDKNGSNGGQENNDELLPQDHFGVSANGGPLQIRHMSNNYPWFGPEYGDPTVLWGRSFTFYYVDKDYYIGAIKVAEVPEPGSAALLLAGLGAIGTLARRRKRG